MAYGKLQKEMDYEGLNSRQLEAEKIKKMFGSKGGNETGPASSEK